MLAEFFKLIGQQCVPSNGKAGGKHNYQCRKDSPDPAGVEIPKPEVAAIKALEDDTRNEKPGYYKENIDADKTTCDSGRKGVKGHDRQHCDGAQSINVWAIVGMAA